MIRSNGEGIYTAKININESEMDQSNLLKKWEDLIINLDQEHWKVKIKTRNTCERAYEN